jgi:hypothetical protein
MYYKTWWWSCLQPQNTGFGKLCALQNLMLSSLKPKYKYIGRKTAGLHFSWELYFCMHRVYVICISVHHKDWVGCMH